MTKLQEAIKILSLRTEQLYTSVQQSSWKSTHDGVLFNKISKKPLKPGLRSSTFAFGKVDGYKPPLPLYPEQNS